MPGKSVAESYPELWHYTTADGLHGILTSQQLWATDISYLSDGEEFIGFFDRKLPRLLEEGVRDGIAEASKTAQGLARIEAAGGAARIEGIIIPKLQTIMRAETLKLPTYVTSFCYTADSHDNDGLLSQWRGYGSDGGYAIVFDTQGLETLMHEESERFMYLFGHFGNVDYYYGQGRGTGQSFFEETREWDAAIGKTIARIIFDQDFRPAVDLFEPTLSLATRHKHRGFSEECEVRISVVTLTKEAIDAGPKAGDNRLKKPVHFTSRSGVLVPHISLFERADGETVKLPIKKIIVGPHPEKLKRQNAVQMLLNQLAIEAEVVPSDIPYLGR